MKRSEKTVEMPDEITGLTPRNFPNVPLSRAPAYMWLCGGVHESASTNKFSPFETVLVEMKDKI